MYSIKRLKMNKERLSSCKHRIDVNCECIHNDQVLQAIQSALITIQPGEQIMMDHCMIGGIPLEKQFFIQIVCPNKAKKKKGGNK